MKMIKEHESGIAKLFHCEPCNSFETEIIKCNHEFKVFKIRYGENENIHIVTKCSKCGQHKKTHKKNEFDINKLDFFDREIESEFSRNLLDAHRMFSFLIDDLRLRTKKRTNAWTIENWYYGYLESNMWNRKREWIMKRANNNCEICGKVASVVHHKTYERVGYELMDDLIALCKSCHGREHGKNKGLNIISQFKLDNLE